MKSRIRISVSICLVAMVMIAGCGPSSSGPIAPVSGKLTIDGQPAPGVEIVFSPVEVKGNPNPGPWSIATTDEEGNFTLETRYKETGAMVGKHHVTMSYPDMEPGAMDVLRAELMDAKASGNDPAEIKAAITALSKKLKGRMVIPASADQEYEVPTGGNRNANFELTSD